MSTMIDIVLVGDVAILLETAWPFRFWLRYEFGNNEACLVPGLGQQIVFRIQSKRDRDADSRARTQR